ncbi:MFS transporter [Natronobacterium gregoryi]|uniref:Arabinose efflux permease family protein n=2 Tax=Natronobacterium gregoryi TaxID=44930 RepID=L0AFQ4_NATGS|nr:MFS transporter [Natronobacterium gregoryi]AFZ72743.1 arabinose efflux permease family protein [Natronobacterium gregoryi SP2]ELY69491.1 major facilitator superfamily protein [Natronobacterium gregoryi SP2]PLK21092.1 MFS transporter [Natronobacterium gregoryi SP2]SFJ68740.1 Predicted arabinose efflux permease, MFS family [Natronobacterium gregoryi]
MSRARLFASLCGLVFLLNLARIIFAPLLDVIIVEFSIGEAAAGLLVTLAWVGSASPRLPTGWLLTKVPRHYVVIGSGAILAVAAAFAATAATVEHLMVGAFLMGIASGVYFVSANPFLSELYPERIGHVMGVHGAANQVAAVLAAPLVAVTVVVDWRLSLWLIAIGAALVTVYTGLAAKRTKLPRAGAEDKNFLAGALSEWRIIVTALALVGLASFVWQGVFNFYELYMLESKRLSSEEASMMLTIVFAAGIPAFYFGGDLADRLPHVRYLLGIVGSFSVSLLVLTAVDGVLGLIVLSAVVGFVIHALFPATDTFLLDTLPDATRGSAYAVFSSVWMLTQSLGSFVLGLFVEAGYSYDLVFRTGAIVLAAVVVVLLLLERTDRLPI